MKIIKYQINIIWILLFMFISQCTTFLDRSYPIYLTNNADHPIGFYFATGGEFGTLHPDSLPDSNKYVTYKMNPGERFIYDSGLSWEEIFEDGAFPTDTLSVFIFHTDTLNAYSWQEIKESYNILKRYDLSFEDLQRINYRLSYPPDSTITGIAMSP